MFLPIEDSKKCVSVINYSNSVLMGIQILPDLPLRADVRKKMRIGLLCRDFLKSGEGKHGQGN